MSTTWNVPDLIAEQWRLAEGEEIDAARLMAEGDYEGFVLARFRALGHRDCAVKLKQFVEVPE